MSALEKPPTYPVSSPPPSSSFFSSLEPVLDPLRKFSQKLSDLRTKADLPSPGSTEQLNQEVKQTLVSYWFTEGGRADFQKLLSTSPTFQIGHSLGLGSSSSASPAQGQNGGTYSFNATYAKEKEVMMTASLESNGSLLGRANYTWSPKDVSKVFFQFPTNPMFQTLFRIEHERLGRDYTLNLQASNLNPGDFTGVYQATYLQSLTKRFQIGSDLEFARQVAPGSLLIEQTAVSWLFKLQSLPSSPSWYSILKLSPATGSLALSYFHRLAPTVDFASELDLSLHPVPREREGIAKVGVKYAFRQGVVRAQVDSKGKVAVTVEQQVAPMLAVGINAEVDHVKGTSRWGVGVTVSGGPMTEEEMAAMQGGR